MRDSGLRPAEALPTDDPAPNNNVRNIAITVAVILGLCLLFGLYVVRRHAAK